MSKKGSTTVVRLLDEYIEKAKTGGSPSIEGLLERCPDAEREDLRLALIGAESLIEHMWMSYISSETVESTLAGMQRIREQKRRLQEAARRLPLMQPQIRQDPINALSTELNWSIPVSPEAVAAARAHAQPTTWLRAQGQISTANSYLFERQRQRILEQRMEEKAAELLSKYDLLHHPINLETLARRLGLLVQDADLDENTDGCLVADEDFGVILLNRRISNLHRRRYTLAHEIAHAILHRRFRVLRDKVSRTGTQSDEQEEKDADVLAAMLLMPPDLLLSQYATERPALRFADEISEAFEVSLLAALRHLVRRSNHACALVFIQEGRIKWAVESNYFEYFVPRNREPDPHSASGMLLKRAFDGQDNQDATALPLSAWASARDGIDDEIKVWEECRRVSVDHTYTLITCIE